MIYNFFYRIIQNLIKSLLGKKNFNEDLSTLINKISYDEIHDIGGSDGAILKYLNLKQKKYFCYDPDFYNNNLGKKRYKKSKNVFFINKSIDYIKITKTKKRRIFIFIGVFHHLSNLQIENFIKQLTENDAVISIDPFYHHNQKMFSILLKKLDKGNFIRDTNGYKKILNGFNYQKKVDFYLKCYSHIIFYNNIKKEVFLEIFGKKKNEKK